MKSYRSCLLPTFALAAFAPQAWAEKEVVIRRVESDSPHRIIIRKDDGEMEKEKVTFLGVETAPLGRALTTQLGLPKDTGLVVTHVLEKSPAADVLREDDVLTKFDDQVLVNMPQLGVLVRARKEGDEVKLTVVRGGKELTVKAKLAVREMPRQAAHGFFFQHGGEPGMFNVPVPPGDMQDPMWQHKLPGMGQGEAQDVLRMIGRERGNIMSGPGVRVFTHKGKGATVLDLPKSNISYSDDDGAIEIKVDDGKRTLTVKDAKGGVMFDGPINTDEERKKLPPEVRKRLEALETDTINFEVGEDFRPDVVPLPPEPAKTKIRHPLSRESRPAAAEKGLRPL